MTPDAWMAVITRLSAAEPVALDTETHRRGNGLCVWPDDAPPPSPRLWARAGEGVSYIGVRVDAPLPDPARAALRLAAAALERGVAPVILSALPQSGFERFGLRVERFAGTDPVERSRWEAEMTSFWNLAFILDARDLTGLG